MTAFKKTVPGMIEDQEEAKRVQRESDKIIYELGEADRLEKSGYRDKAQGIIDKAAARAQQLNETVAKIKMEQERSQVQRENTATTAAATAESRRQHNEEGKFRSLANAKDHLARIESVIATEENSDIDKRAKEFVTNFEGKDEKKLDENVRVMLDNSRKILKTYEDRHNTLRSNAESDVDTLYRRIYPEGRSAGATTNKNDPLGLR